MHKIIVSAPFGNYLKFKNTTPTIGTYTVQHPGLCKRIWRFIKTVRYNFRNQFWTNKLGLPNPGINSLKGPLSDSILSIHGFNEEEWTVLLDSAWRLNVLAAELNLSCPNVEKTALNDVLNAVKRASVKIIAKLPPIRWMEWGKPLYEAGVRTFHLCNTMPSPGGGISGKPLMQYSLWAIEDFRKTFGDYVTLIGGGGVTCLKDVKTYLNAGANHVSIASMLLNPLNWLKIKQF